MKPSSFSAKYVASASLASIMSAVVGPSTFSPITLKRRCSCLLGRPGLDRSGKVLLLTVLAVSLSNIGFNQLRPLVKVPIPVTPNRAKCLLNLTVRFSRPVQSNGIGPCANAPRFRA